MRENKGRRGRCDVALLVDAETGERRRNGRFVPDRGSMEAYMLDCLNARSRNVTVIPFDRNVIDTIRTLREARPRLVFNLTEWVDSDRRLDAAITGLLEIMKLRYTGTGPTGLRLARDKALSKKIVADLGVAVPRHFVLGRRDRIHDHGLSYPIVVKPLYGDGSDEIRNNSIVLNARQLRERVRGMRGRVNDPLVCEEFIPGRDVYVALLGNAPDVMPAVELVVGKKGRSAPLMATYRVKNEAAYRTRWRIRWRKAALDRSTVRQINDASRKIFHALSLRDYGRIDYRLTPDNRLVFLEANPNPDLHPHAMGINLCFAGIDYPQLIRRIVGAAKIRYRLRT